MVHVTVHVMVLRFSETYFLGTHFVSFDCVISKVLPNNFCIKSRLLSALSSHISLEELASSQSGLIGSSL